MIAALLAATLSIFASAVEVRAKGYAGTGVIVYAREGKTRILTAAHVAMNDDGVTPRDELKICMSAGIKSRVCLGVRVLLADQRLDLALLAFDSAAIKPAAVLPVQLPSTFESVYLVGAPGGVLLGVYPGRLVDINGGDPTLTWNFAGYVAGGMSGGPVLNERGELVCIIQTAFLFPRADDDHTQPRHIQGGQCASAWAIRAFLARAGVLDPPPAKGGK